MVSTRPPNSKSFRPLSNPFVTVPNAPITNGIIVTCMFHSFFNSLARSRYLSFFSHSFSFILWSAGTAKSTILQVLFFVDYYYYYSFSSFSYQRWPLVFHWSLRDSKSPQIYRSLLSILADLNNAVPWMLTTSPLISKSFSLCTNPLVTLPSAPVTIDITVTFMFHSFFSSLAKSRYLSFFRFLSVLLCDQPEQ